MTPKNIANAGTSVNEPAWGVRLVALVKRRGRE